MKQKRLTKILQKRRRCLSLPTTIPLPPSLVVVVVVMAIVMGIHYPPPSPFLILNRQP